MNQINKIDIQTAVSKSSYIKDACCESYKTQRGRCFSCPNATRNKDPDKEIY
ncbi:hypothetical protein HOC01_04720 [archaeon]|jgi:hypothetical protein|nr:hypothetical protein [archaeon]MBT6698270.1 hypothetical protein [archaeon]